MNKRKSWLKRWRKERADCPNFDMYSIISIYISTDCLEPLICNQNTETYKFAKSSNIWRNDEAGRHQKWPFLDQKWPNMAGLPMSRCGPKGSQMVPNGQYNMFLTIWAHLDPFGPFHTKFDFLLQTTLAKKHFVFLRRNIDFCLKRSKMVQMGPNGSKW